MGTPALGTRGVKQTSLIPTYVTAAAGALAKVKRIRDGAKTSKKNVCVLGDSNHVPIDNISSNSKLHGLTYSMEAALRRMRKFDSKQPQMVDIHPHAGGGTKPLDSYGNPGSPASLIRGTCRVPSNIGGTIPFNGLGCSWMFRDTGESSRNWYCIIDTTSNGPPELQGKTKVRIMFGVAQAGSGGNNPSLNTTNTLEIDGTAYAGATYQPGFSNITVTVLDITSQSVSNPITAGETTAVDALTGSSITLTNNDIGAYYGGFLSADLTINGNKKQLLRFSSTGNGSVERILVHDGAAAGINLFDSTLSGNSHVLGRYNSYDVNGVVDQTNPVLIALLHRCAAQAQWAGFDANVTSTQTSAFSAAHNPFGLHMIIDSNWMNEVNDGVTGFVSQTPARVAADLADKCAYFDGRTSTQEAVVIKIIPPAAFGSLATSATTRNALYTGTGVDFKHNDYVTALKAVQAQYPNTCILIDLQKAWGDLLPMDLKLAIGHSGIYDASTNLNLDNLHFKHFAYSGRAAEEVKRLIDIYCG